LGVDDVFLFVVNNTFFLLSFINGFFETFAGVVVVVVVADLLAGIVDVVDDDVNSSRERSRIVLVNSKLRS
jgi:hypothetical protein